MVVLLTGPSAAGKTTVARLLAEMTPGAEDDQLAQLELRYRIAAAAADAYAAAGFTVVHEDVVAGPLLARHARETTIVLLPSLETLERRAAARARAYGAFTPAELHRLFSEQTLRVGTWIDTTAQAPEETVDAILAQLPSCA